MLSEITPRYQRCLEITGLIVAARCSFMKLQPTRVSRSPVLSLKPGVDRESQWLSEIIDLRDPAGLNAHFLAHPAIYRRRLFENFATIVLAGQESITLSNPLWLKQGGSQDSCVRRIKRCHESFDMSWDDWYPDVSLFLQARSRRILGQNWGSVVQIALKLHDGSRLVESDFNKVKYPN